MDKKDCAVIILAAGNSSRMGSPKFILKMPDGSSFLEYISNQYTDFGCSEIIVVVSEAGLELLKDKPQKLAPTVKIILNDHGEYGRLYSINKGLAQLKSDCVFIHNIDNPFAHKEILEQLYLHKDTADYVKPVAKGQGGHPILLSKKVIDSLMNEKNRTIKLKDFLHNFSFKKVKITDHSVLTNINTHEEYLAFYHRKIR